MLRMLHSSFAARDYLVPGLAIAFICCLACGCSSMQAPESPGEFWIPPESEAVSLSHDPLWDAMKADDVIKDKPLSLVELLDIALEKNPDVRNAWHLARSSAEAKTETDSAWYPKASVSATAGRERSDTETQDNVDYNTYGPSASLTWLVYDFGGRSAKSEEARQTLIAANLDFNQALLDAVLALRTAYYEQCAAELQVKAAADSVEEGKATLDAARAKDQQGLASKLDVLKAEASYDSALYTLEQANGGLESARAELARTLGIPAGAPIKVRQMSDNPPAVGPQNVKELIERAISRRPDLAALRADVRGKKAAYRSATSGLWPELNIGASAQKTWYKYDADTEDTDKDDIRAYAELSWTIFEGFNTVALRRKAIEDLRAGEEQLKSAEIDASADVWKKYSDYKTGLKKLKYAEAYLASAGESFDLASQGYKAGLKSMLDVLDAQSSLSDARSRLVDARKELFQALANLAHVTGAMGIKDNAMLK